VAVVTLPPASVRTGLYARISQDAEGSGLGVARQEADARVLADRRGWKVAELYVDNDISAYSGKARPAYRRLLADIQSSRIDAVVAWHPDRLHRSPLELEEFIKLIEAHGVAVETVQAGRVDLSTPAGRLQARMLGNIARYESEHKSERIKGKMRELAEAGKVGGGGVRPYGFERDRATHRAEEVAVIREAARRLLTGETLYAIVKDLTARGVPTSTGTAWTTTSLKSTLIRPRIAGLREHRGEVVGPAVWEAVLDEVTWRRIVALLTDPARSRNRSPRSYLLTGILRCGRCGSPMVAAPRGAGRSDDETRLRSVRAYGCTANGGCHHVFVLAEPAEAFVETAVLRRLAGPRLERARARLASSSADSDAALFSKIAADEQMVADLAVDYTDRRLSRAAFLAANDRVQARLDGLRGRLADRARPDVLEGLGDLRAEWPHLSTDRRRAVLDAVLTSVSVAPVGRARNRFDSDRLRLVWRV
jgi:DNA invertase Pin-like site-specific DNA recombinase